VFAFYGKPLRKKLLLGKAVPLCLGKTHLMQNTLGVGIFTFDAKQGLLLQIT
jgi:hypothetical protein